MKHSFYTRPKTTQFNHDPRIDEDILLFESKLNQLKQPGCIPSQTSKAKHQRALALRNLDATICKASISVLEHFKEGGVYPAQIINQMKANIPAS